MSINSFFTTIRDLASPRVWSTGVEIARTADFVREGSPNVDDQTFRLVRGQRDKVETISLSIESEMWQCTCTEEDDPCAHVVATVIALKQRGSEQELVRETTTLPAQVVYRFARANRFLTFERVLVWFDGEFAIKGSLADGIAQLSNIRNAPRTVTTERSDYSIDHILGIRKDGILEPKVMRLLLPALAQMSHVQLDRASITVNPEPLLSIVQVRDQQDRVHIKRVLEHSPEEIFENGAAICNQELRVIHDTSLSATDIHLVDREGTYFARDQFLDLAGRILPALEARIHVDNQSTQLPKARRIPPRIVVQTIGEKREQRLTVVPRLVYGNPPIAEVVRGRLKLLSPTDVPVRDQVEESRLTRDLLSRVGLHLDQAKPFEGPRAHDLIERLKGWETTGNGVAVFTPAATLEPHIVGSGRRVDITFTTPDGTSVPFDRGYRAWKNGESLLALDDGTWVSLPSDWLSANAELVRGLFAAKDSNGQVAAHQLPVLETICEGSGVMLPDYFSRLRTALTSISGIPDVDLPGDLTATLRSYQRTGVNWLTFMRDHEIGCLLADDMGLGKTVQAICILRARSLVVAPTSVLYSWESQLRTFRPGLSVCIYHGPNRSLDLNADVVLTTYSILRIDAENLAEQTWNVIVLDEAQTIRNPESQVAQAAYKLSGQFRLTLSGTPVENALSDLWSQFHFLNRGLLGERQVFVTTFLDNSGEVSSNSAQQLQRMIRPFLLRRLKRDVAPELPPKTEVVLECELSESERNAYQTILATSRAEVIAHLEATGNVLSVLEILLRLRQACCHIGLLPGQIADGSSKLDLLLEHLENSLLQSHRSLIFSQWTSLLDLLEPVLAAKDIRYSRIDGSTKDRARIVEDFQNEGGPDVMLLSLKAGGLGLTLTAADHVYILDPWWNPAIEDQAGDRAHRIGQRNPVVVHRLVARDTIEERLLFIQDRKRSLLSAAVGEGGELSLTRQELLELLA